MTYDTNPRGARTYGADYNFFQKVSVSNVQFPTSCDVLINLASPTNTIMIYTTSGAVEFSFNGSTLHGESTSGTITGQLEFRNMVASKIWFRGTGTVCVYAWA